MTDNKLTDNEIIEALEVCVGIHNDCGNCPLLEYSQATDECMTEAMSNALDLINRQKAEIARLQSILLKFVREINNFENKHNIDTSDFSLIPILEEENNNLVKQIRTEAIKEILDKLIDISVCKDNGDGTQRLYVSIPKAREVLKEMVGESEWKK